ncbi:MAG: DMT family transporter [Anaerolineales bacterium]|nr:DMT family transporter [Anaerolineales bacterium]
MNKRLGWTLAFLSSLAYSTNVHIARGAILEGMNPTTLLTGRFLLAAFLFGITISFTSVGKAKGEQRPLDKRGFFISLATGSLNGFTLMAFYWALTRLSASLTSMLSIGLYPLVTLLLLMIRGETLTRRNLARLALGLVGLYFLIGPGGDVDLGGIILVVLGAAFFAVHIVSVQWFLRGYNTWMTTAVMVTAAMGIVTLMWLFTGQDTYVPGATGWVAILMQGIVATYIGRLATYGAISILGSGQVALFAPLETLLTIFWSFLFLNETLTPLQLVGGLFILSGTALASEKVRWRRLRPV